MPLLPQEFKEASKGKGQEIGITLIPLNDNIFVWKALLVVSASAVRDKLCDAAPAASHTSRAQPAQARSCSYSKQVQAAGITNYCMFSS